MFVERCLVVQFSKMLKTNKSNWSNETQTKSMTVQLFRYSKEFVLLTWKLLISCARSVSFMYFVFFFFLTMHTTDLMASSWYPCIMRHKECTDCSCWRYHAWQFHCYVETLYTSIGRLILILSITLCGTIMY